MADWLSILACGGGVWLLATGAVDESAPGSGGLSALLGYTCALGSAISASAVYLVMRGGRSLFSPEQGIFSQGAFGCFFGLSVFALADPSPRIAAGDEAAVASMLAATA